ncbi:hypothetical protein H0H92_002281 [Tricholoma furcatifolium]|nr:hypothetical protein H0H92_002281 [Tricholoma furcatifolium]
MPACPYCSAHLQTDQGLNSHLLRVQTCRKQFLAIHTSAHRSATAQDKDIPQYAEGILDGHDLMQDQPAPSPAPSPPPQQTSTVANNLDDSNSNARWVAEYPGEAGTIYTCKTTFEKLRCRQEDAGLQPWAPFANEAEWELAQWLMTSGVSQTKMDTFLKLKSICDGAKPTFHNARSLLKRIDQLPRGPEWTCQSFQLTGDEKDPDGNFLTQEIELWHRNPVECIKELLESPFIGKKNAYQPIRVYRDHAQTNRKYSETNTGDWMWETQKKLPAGATLVPVILSSDKTSLTNFSGDKQAYPVYLAIGTTAAEIRRQPSAHAMVLVGYIPVCKLECFSAKRVEGYQLFHDCMRKIMVPLIEAGKEGVSMQCADGFVRKVYPILAAYIADYPEQCLVACCQENSCPTCCVPPNKRGDPIHSIPRDPEKTLHILKKARQGLKQKVFEDQSLRPINPFWRDLPHCNIFTSITPNALHQLHKGVFKDHIVKWSTEAVLVPKGEDEIDRRFRSITPHQSLRHFKKGIKLTSQWTGTEYKNMEKVFLGILAGATDPAVIRCVRGVLDFIYYAQFEVHTDETLTQLDAAWVAFHENKQVFEDLAIRKHFNISKVHNIRHYLDSIRSLGSASGYNTEATERLHIDLAKVGYRASNKKENYTKQMTVWLRRQEAITKFGLYLQWTIPKYAACMREALGSREDADSEVEEEEEREAEKDLQQQTVVHIAKKPPLPRVSLTSIHTDFGATQFLPHLTTFLRQQAFSLSQPLTEYTTFPVYHRLRLSLPPIPEVSRTALNLKDSVIATRFRPAVISRQGIKRAMPAKFSTVLVRVGVEEGVLDGPLIGIRVAQVRLIFNLPDTHGVFWEPLVYVHWFKPLRKYDTDLGMFQTSFSSQNHQRRASIIPASHILRSCHLSPVFGRTADPTWVSHSVVDSSPSFYLNPYLRHYDFYHLRYLPALYTYHTRSPEELNEQRKAALLRAARYRVS